MSTKVDILDALVAELQGIPEVKLATRFVQVVSDAENSEPSIQVVNGPEIPLVIDATDILYSMMVSLHVITAQDEQEIEPLIDKIKDELLGTTCPPDLHANLQVISLLSTDIVELEDEDSSEFASALLILEIRYHASKTGF